jgi:phosphoribosylformimino-5-aminoimidazole carboxamide ribotide isomerase
VDLYPAIDLLEGRSVRLYQGDFDKRTVYGDAVETAVRLARSAVAWLHVVDLDAARTGEARNRHLVGEIIDAVDVAVQVGGGIRDERAAAELLEAGAARVVMGTAALDAPSVVRRVARSHPGRVAVGLDQRAGRVAVRGWVEDHPADLGELLSRFEDAGLGAVVVTDVGRDGTMAGPDLDGLSAVLGATGVDVVASGGVGGPADLEALARLRVGERRLAGAIVGKALHDGVMGIEEALAACAASG